MAKYKFADQAGTKVNDIEKGIFGIHRGVHLWSEVEKFLDGGGVIEEFETTTEIQEREAREVEKVAIEQARVYAKDYPKLKALYRMTPAQVETWVQNNVNTLADAKDAIKTLAIAVSILAKNI